MISSHLHSAAKGRHQIPEAFAETGVLDPPQTAEQRPSKPFS